MNKYAFMTATALALAAGSAQAACDPAGGVGLLTGCHNGVQLNGITVSGFAVEAVELADGSVLAGVTQGSGIQPASLSRPTTLIRSSGG